MIFGRAVRGTTEIQTDRIDRVVLYDRDLAAIKCIKGPGAWAIGGIKYIVLPDYAPTPQSTSDLKPIESK